LQRGDVARAGPGEAEWGESGSDRPRGDDRDAVPATPKASDLGAQLVDRTGGDVAMLVGDGRAADLDDDDQVSSPPW
jgi:hypothetical protein